MIIDFITADHSLENIFPEKLTVYVYTPTERDCSKDRVKEKYPLKGTNRHLTVKSRKRQ